MQIKVNRVRHPLASFQGEITVEGQKTATAEEVKLAFDYYPVIDGEKTVTEGKIAPSNGNGIHGVKEELLEEENTKPRFVNYSEKE